MLGHRPVVGAAAPALARRLGPERLLAAAMAFDAAELLARAFAGSFPEAIGRITAVHSTALATGWPAAPALTPAVAQAWGVAPAEVAGTAGPPNPAVRRQGYRTE